MKFRTIRNGCRVLLLFVGITFVFSVPGFVRCSGDVGDVDSQADRAEYNSVV